MAEAETEYRDVRVEESLRVKIGEAKNLPASSFSGSSRNTCCAIKIDSEEIYRTSTVEKSLDPFFGAEFQGEIPRKFRYLSFYVYEVGNKNKVLGKVSLKKEELYKYHQKEHWFPLTYQDGDTEVHGKVQVEVKLDEYLTPTADTSHKMAVRVLECSDLTVINGSCNPYAVVSLGDGKSKPKEVKKTAVRKKTICPQFDETFFFHLDNKGQNQERSLYVCEDLMAGELSVSLYHDDSKVSREVLGNIFKGVFLGEVKIPIKDIDMSRPHKAWYCLQAKEQNRSSDQSLGSIRLRISYTADYVFPSKYYDGLRNLILNSVETKPFTSSAAFILGEIVENRESAAQPLVKLFLHHGRLVPLIHALADWEMSTTIDPNTLFRGNSLLTKMVDELMKLMGMPYLHDTLKSFIVQVVTEAKPCEIDPTRLKEGEDLASNLTNLHTYVNDALNTIVSSGLVCPSVMRDVFSTLKSRAMLNYPDNFAVRYHAVTSFIFLRFFTAAIMGPNLFDLHSDIPDAYVQRTFTLISKGISGLVNLVSSKSNNITAREEYMVPLFEMFPKSARTDIKMFLDIISSSSGSHFKGIEAPIVLKEGFLIKRAQGRKRFGLKNFKKRFFRLTNQSLSYSKSRADKHQLFEIPITDILAVERLEEESFKMKYMFQVVHAQRALYIQASNCVEEKEWLDILMKICKSNKHRLKDYHPAAFVNNHWLCCKSTDPAKSGCKPVTGGLPLTDIQADIDSDREVEKIHSLFLTGIEKLDALQETCGSQAVYSGELDIKVQGLGSNIEDPSSCFATIAEIQRCIITLEQEHIQYMRSVQRRTVIGSIDTPIGDESNADLVRNMNRSSERLSRHGSRSSNASNISRRSYRGCRSRGGSFREKGKGEGNGVRKSLSGDMTASTRSLGVDFKLEVKKAASYDVMVVESSDRGDVGRVRHRTVSSGSEREKDTSGVDTSGRGDNSLISDSSMIGACHKMASDDSMLSVPDSNDETIPDREPKKSTGFVPSSLMNSLDPQNYFSHLNGDVPDGFENYSITAPNSAALSTNDEVAPDSPSSQNVGVLETSLESNEIITTTTLSNINSTTNQPALPCHRIDTRYRDYEQDASSSESHSHLNQHTSSLDHISHHQDSEMHSTSHSSGDHDGLECHGSTSDSPQGQKTQSDNLPQISDVRKQSTSDSVFVNDNLRTDETLSSLDQTTNQPGCGGIGISVSESGLRVSTSSQNSGLSSSPGQIQVTGQDYSALRNNLLGDGMDQVDVSNERGSVTSDYDGSGAKDVSVLTSEQQGTYPPSKRRQDVLTSCSSYGSQASSSSVGRQLSRESDSAKLQSQLEKQTSAGEGDLFICEVEAPKETGDEDLDRNACEQQTDTAETRYPVHSGIASTHNNQQNNGSIAQLSDPVKYSLPELTSSSKAYVHSTEPKGTTPTMSIGSLTSTPAISPIDVSSVEIMLASQGSDSSQEKS